MRLPTSRRLVLAAAGTALTALAALPATAGCADSAFGCGLDHDQTSAVPVSARTVAAVLTPKSDDVARQAYADLLPEGFEVPGAPLVAVQVSTFDTGACVKPDQAALPADCPALPGWSESVVALRALVDGAEGWYAVSRGTTSAEEFAAGREAGLPTYLATGSVAAKGAGLAGALSVGGTEALGLEWQPQSGVRVSNEAFDLLQGRTGTFGVTPLFEGTDRHRTTRAVRPTVPVFDLLAGAPNSSLAVPGLTGTSFPRRGAVTVRINPDVDALDAGSPEQLPDLPLAEGVTLADVVAPVTAGVPGVSWDVDGLLITQVDALDDGADGPLPAPPAVTSGVVAPPGAQTGGFATRVVTVTRGSSLTFANLDTTQHDVTSALTGPDRKPLFHSATTGQGVVPVEGVELLPAGQYTWVCSLHAGMTGELVVG